MTSKSVISFATFALLVNCFVSIVPHLLLKPFWNMESDYLIHSTIFEGLYTLILLPFLLIFINKWFSKRFIIDKIPYLTISLLSISFSIIISNYFHYQNFGDMTGRGSDPDIGTKTLNIVIPIIGILIVMINLGIKLLKQIKKIQ